MNLESRENKVFENKDLCNIAMSFKDTIILEFNQCRKSDKAPFITYEDLESLIKTDRCKNNPEKSSPTKTGDHISSGFSMSTNRHLKT